MESLETGVDGYPQAVAAWLGILAGEPVDHEDGMKRWRGMVGRWARHPAMRRKALLALLTPLLEKVEQAILEWPRPVESKNPNWVNVWLKIRELLADDPELWHRGALLAQMADQGAWPPRETAQPPKVIQGEAKPAPAAPTASVPQAAPAPSSRKTEMIAPSAPLHGVEEVRPTPAPIKDSVAKSGTAAPPQSASPTGPSLSPTPAVPGPSVEAQGGVARVGFPVRSLRRIVRGSDSPPSKPS